MNNFHLCFAVSDIFNVIKVKNVFLSNKKILVKKHSIHKKSSAIRSPSQVCLWGSLREQIDIVI